MAFTTPEQIVAEYRAGRHGEVVRLGFFGPPQYEIREAAVKAGCSLEYACLIADYAKGRDCLELLKDMELQLSDGVDREQSNGYAEQEGI